MIKIVHENPKIDDDDVIQVDRKITECIKVGDRIVIDCSKCVLKVISIDRYKRKNSICKMPGFRSQHRLQSNTKKIEYGCYTDDLGGEFEIPAEEISLINNSIIGMEGNILPIIEEKR